jgi:hypothetical protein
MMPRGAKSTVISEPMSTTVKHLLVTHVSPDLDGLLGLWILIRFGGYENYELAFTPVGSRPHPDPHAIHVDTGWIQFDHHQRTDVTSSAKLVYETVFAVRNDKAIEALVNYALAVDWYLQPDTADSPFTINAVIEGLNQLFPDEPRVVAERTFVMLDALYRSLALRIEAEQEYEKGSMIDSIYGPAFAIETSAHHVREIAHRNGARVFVFVDPATGYRGFKGRSQSGIDFTKIYEKVCTLEPDADWFLHVSKELLLCGSAKAPDRRLSQLDLQALVRLIKAPVDRRRSKPRHDTGKKKRPRQIAARPSSNY